MSGLEALIASGRIVDMICLLVFVEAVAIVVIYLRSGRGMPPAEALPTLLSGLCLLLALRGALTQAGWEWVALSLVGALAAHVIDLAQRWRH